jgi:hypothetical protein
MTVNKKNIIIVAVIILVLLISGLIANSLNNPILGGYTSTSGTTDWTDDVVTRSFDSSSMAPEIAGTEESYILTDEIVAQGSIMKEQYVIKTGNLNMVVDNVEETAQMISDLAKTFGGSITNRYIYSYEDVKEGTVELTVDKDQFEPAMQAIKELGTRINSENINADDVTEAVIDLQARLENAQAEEQAYLDIMTKATKVEDILNVQYYLSNVRATIESYQAQLEYYENHTSRSTITVFLTESTSIVLDSDAFQPWQTIKDSVQTVIRMFQNLVLYVIEVIIIGGAIIIPIAILYFGGRFIYRRYKK